MLICLRASFNRGFLCIDEGRRLTLVCEWRVNPSHFHTFERAPVPANAAAHFVGG